MGRQVIAGQGVNTKIIVVSDIREELTEASIRHFMLKPFTSKGLLDAVRDALDF